MCEKHHYRLSLVSSMRTGFPCKQMKQMAVKMRHAAAVPSHAFHGSPTSCLDGHVCSLHCERCVCDCSGNQTGKHACTLIPIVYPGSARMGEEVLLHPPDLFCSLSCLSA